MLEKTPTPLIQTKQFLDKIFIFLRLCTFLGKNCVFNSSEVLMTVVIFSVDDETHSILPIFFQALDLVCFPAIPGTPLSLVLETIADGTPCIAAMAVRSVRVSSRLATRISVHVWTRNIVDVDWGVHYPISFTFQRVVVFVATRSYSLYMMSFE